MNNQKYSSSKLFGIYRRMFPFVSPYLPRLLLGLICGILYGGSTFGLIIVLRFALGGLIGEEFSGDNPFSLMSTPEGNASELELSRIICTLFLLPGVAVIQGSVSFAGRYFVEWSGSRVITDLRQALYEHMHALPIQFFTGSRVGELMTRISSDTGLLMALVTNVIGDLMKDPFTLIGCIAAMFYLDWQLTLIILVVFPFCLVPIALFGKRIRLASKVGQVQMGDMFSLAQEGLTGAMVVKAFQREQDEVNRFGYSNLQVFKQSMRQLRARAITEPILFLLISFGLAGVLYYAFVNDISLALIVSFFAATAQMYKPFKKLSQIHLRFQTAAPGAERVFEILDREIEITDDPQAVELRLPIQTIELNGVSFGYDDKLVLDDIDLKVESGKCVAFVGSSGAGKSSLVNLVPRFYDVLNGSVKINDQDVRSLKVESLRSHIGIVTQDTILFNRSVAENIAYGVPSASIDDVVDAAKRANADSFIQKMELGYDTIIGERGSRLSGGMAQRITIARALLKNPPILILDEATSALDTESERLVQRALDELMKDRTVLVIAHRLSTIANADHIVVLEQGQIIEQGTHEYLLKQNGKYRYFYELQFQPND
ncbi:MAG: ABC transporter ATP-binding protein [Pontiellaceae bacterium]